MGILSFLKSCFSSVFSNSNQRNVFPFGVSESDRFTIPPAEKDQKNSAALSKPKPKEIQWFPFGHRKNKSEGHVGAKRRLWLEYIRAESDFLALHYICRPVGLDENLDLLRWEAAILGPSGTPYEGGIFLLSIKLTEDYPFKAPQVKFLTKVYHPNIDRDGTTHIELLGTKWLMSMTIEKVVLLVCSFLPDPNPEDPENPVSVMYWNDRKSYNEIARKWTMKYARRSTKKYARAFKRLNIPAFDDPK